MFLSVHSTIWPKAAGQVTCQQSLCSNKFFQIRSLLPFFFETADNDIYFKEILAWKLFGPWQKITFHKLLTFSSFWSNQKIQEMSEVMKVTLYICIYRHKRSAFFISLFFITVNSCWKNNEDWLSIHTEGTACRSIHSVSASHFSTEKNG